MRIPRALGALTLLISTMTLYAADQVRVSGGLLEGTPGSRPGIRAFLGIPYAAPPVGPMRWKAPQPAAKWSGVRPANHFGNRCVQTTPFPDMVFQSPAESEDCLYLSVWTPAKSATERLPVMVWIHGGGYFSGSGDETRHNGSFLASKGVVLVTINYRLGVLGFLAHPELTAESPHKASGNYAMLDQIEALKWVRDNIAAFGGDPGKVTIFGESAGSFAVSGLMASPLANGLFHRVIGESGAHFSAPGGSLAVTPLSLAEKAGTEFATSVGAKSFAELRALPAASFAKVMAKNPTQFSLVVDGYALTADPWDVFAQGRQSHVPLLAGWNSAESKNMIPSATTSAALEAQLRKQFPGNEDAALKAYPIGKDDRQTLLSGVALASDNFIAYCTWKWLQVHTATGKAPVYRYLFDHIIPTATGDAPANDPGAGHATDIEFVFSTLDTKKLAWRDSDRKVAELITSYWTNFAKNGNPNGPGLPQWPAWDAKGRQLLRLNASPHAENETNRTRYELQDALTMKLRGKM